MDALSLPPPVGATPEGSARILYCSHCPPSQPYCSYACSSDSLSVLKLGVHPTCTCLFSFLSHGITTRSSRMDPGAECNSRSSFAASLLHSDQTPHLYWETTGNANKGTHRDGLCSALTIVCFGPSQENQNQAGGPETICPSVYSFLYMSFPSCPRPGSNFVRLQSVSLGASLWHRTSLLKLSQRVMQDVHGWYQKRSGGHGQISL